MRLYFLRNGHIAAVEILDAVKDDETAIYTGSKRFLARVGEGFEAFEIWERDRVVYRYPGDDDNRAGPASGQNGKSRSGGTSGGKKSHPRGGERLPPANVFQNASVNARMRSACADAPASFF